MTKTPLSGTVYRQGASESLRASGHCKNICKKELREGTFGGIFPVRSTEDSEYPGVRPWRGAPWRGRLSPAGRSAPSSRPVAHPQEGRAVSLTQLSPGAETRPHQRAQTPVLRHFAHPTQSGLILRGPRVQQRLSPPGLQDLPRGQDWAGMGFKGPPDRGPAPPRKLTGLHHLRGGDERAGGGSLTKPGTPVRPPPTPFSFPAGDKH